MIIILPIFVITLFLCYYNKSADIVFISIKTFLAYSALTVVFAEFLSVFKIYSIIPLTLLWLGVSIVVLINIRKAYDTGVGYILKAKMLSAQIYNIYKAHKSIIILSGVIIVLAIMRAALYPPQNVDSLMYHLSRAFFYYKNSAVANFPSSYAWSNYTGPLNAIFMSQFLIFLKGSDFLHNFIQFMPWIMTSFAVYGISMNLGSNKKWAAFSGLLALMLPEAVLQATTTQCDLLVASYSVISVYVMTRLIKKFDIKDFVYLGIAGGCAVLAKVSAGIVLLPFIIVFSIYIVFKNKNLKSLIAIFAAGISAIVIPLGYWIRTGIDLNGDFLAFKVSTGMSHFAEGTVIQNLLGRIIVNIGYLFGGGHYYLSKIMDRVIGAGYKAVKATELDIEGFTAFTQYISHDEQPCLLHMLFIAFSVLIIFFTFFKIKNTQNIISKSYIYTYMLCGIISFVGIAISISAGITSIARYIMGPVFIMLPLVAILGTTLSQNVKFAEITKAFFHFGIITVFASAIVINIGDAKHPLTINPANYSYEGLRNRSYFGKGYDDAAQEYKQLVDENGYTKIGFMETEIGGYYPALYKFGDKQYETKSIYGKHGESNLDKDFVPDCIVYVGADAQKNYIEYKGHIYIAQTEENELLFNGAKSRVYTYKK